MWWVWVGRAQTSVLLALLALAFVALSFVLPVDFRDKAKTGAWTAGVLATVVLVIALVGWGLLRNGTWRA